MRTLDMMREVPQETFLLRRLFFSLPISFCCLCFPFYSLSSLCCCFLAGSVSCSFIFSLSFHSLVRSTSSSAFLFRLFSFFLYFVSPSLHRSLFRSSQALETRRGRLFKVLRCPHSRRNRYAVSLSFSFFSFCLPLCIVWSLLSLFFSSVVC
jgi:hypothetical protein